MRPVHRLACVVNLAAALLLFTQTPVQGSESWCDWQINKAYVQQNFTGMEGWYCSVHPGSSEHTCIYDQEDECVEACQYCGTGYNGTEECEWQRGGSMGDSTAQYLGCESYEYAHYYEVECDCGYPLL